MVVWGCRVEERVRGGIIKGQKDTLGGDGRVHYLDCGVDKELPVVSVNKGCCNQQASSRCSNPPTHTQDSGWRKSASWP